MANEMSGARIRHLRRRLFCALLSSLSKEDLLDLHEHWSWDASNKESSLFREFSRHMAVVAPEHFRDTPRALKKDDSVLVKSGCTCVGCAPLRGTVTTVTSTADEEEILKPTPGGAGGAGRIVRIARPKTGGVTSGCCFKESDLELVGQGRIENVRVTPVRQPEPHWSIETREESEELVKLNELAKGVNEVSVPDAEAIVEDGDLLVCDVEVWLADEWEVGVGKTSSVELPIQSLKGVEVRVKCGSVRVAEVDIERLADSLVGLKVGEWGECEVILPADYKVIEGRCEQAVIRLLVKSVKRRLSPIKPEVRSAAPAKPNETPPKLLCDRCRVATNERDSNEVELAISRQPASIYKHLERTLDLPPSRPLSEAVICGTCYSDAFVAAKKLRDADAAPEPDDGLATLLKSLNDRLETTRNERVAWLEAEVSRLWSRMMILVAWAVLATVVAGGALLAVL